MNAESIIGILGNDGTVTCISCRWDGHPGHTGVILSEYYTDKKKVEELIDKGNLNCLRKNINPNPNLEHSLDNPQKDVCIFYHRDRGDSWGEVTPLIYSNVEEWVEDVDASSIKYMYLFKDSSWFYRSTEIGGWNLLKKNDDMTKQEIIEKAIRMCNKLVDQYDNNRNITDIDICYVIETLKGITDGRHCYECGNENFESGYVINDGEEYYCSDKCLFANYSEEDYLKMYVERTAYWTQWDD